MQITRLVNTCIGIMTLVASFVASTRRYNTDGEFGPTLLLTSAIFGFVAVTLPMTLRRRPAPGAASMSAGLVWLLLLILTAVATWDLIPSAGQPAVGLFLAVVVGVVLGAAAAPSVDLGPHDDDRA